MISPGNQGQVPRTPDRPRTSRTANRRQFFPRVDGDFQWRYSFALALAVGITLVTFMTPFLYFLNENFEIFRALAVDHQPNLLEHIEREVSWITTVAFGGLVFAVLFAIAFGYKLTGSIMGPLFSIERHMKIVSGGDWSRSDFRVRATDEFKRLATAYAHLYRVVRTDMNDDLETLKHLRSLASAGRNAEEIRFTLSKLIDAKEAKLGIPKSAPVLSEAPPDRSAEAPSDRSSDLSASSVESREKRRAS